MKNLFISSILVLSCLLSINCSTAPKTTLRAPADDFDQKATQTADASTKINHFVISLHGVGGDITTFGSLDQVLLKHMAELRPQENLTILNFLYPTGSHKLNTFEFAYEHFNQFLERKIPQLNPNDKITIIAHSQGGIIASIWYTGVSLMVTQDGLPDESLKRFQKYTRATKTILTIGTPFWGSKLSTALLYENGLDAENNLLLTKLLKVGMHELKEMSFLSNTIYQFRKSSIALSSKPEFKNLPFPKFINLSGIFPRDNEKLFYDESQVNDNTNFKIAEKAVRFINKYLKQRSFSSEFVGSDKVDRNESDIAVIIPSARSEFLYAADQVLCGRKNVISPSDFRHAEVFNNSKFILTESIHSQITAPRSVGMASIPLFCIDPESCTHPNYRYILTYVANCGDGQCNKSAENDIIDRMFIVNAKDNEYSKKLSQLKDLQGFSLEISLRVPPQYSLPVNFYEPHTQGGDVNWMLSQNKKSIFSVAHIDHKLMSQKFKDQSELVEIKLARDSEFFSKIITEHEITFRRDQNKDIRIHLTGLIKPKFKLAIENESSTPPEVIQKTAEFYELIKNGITIPLRVKMPESLHFDRKNNDNAEILVQATIKPGYSTFVDLDYRQGINCNR